MDQVTIEGRRKPTFCTSGAKVLQRLTVASVGEGCVPLGFSRITRVFSGRLATKFQFRLFRQFDTLPQNVSWVTPNT